MEEPPYMVNGKELNINDQPAPLDEFVIAGDFLLTSDAPPTKYKSSDYEEIGGYRAKVTSEGIDWRGLPMINYLGEMRPHYSVLDKDTLDSLLIEQIAKLRNYRTLYPELQIMGDEALTKLTPNSLHTYAKEVEKSVNGRTYGVMYEKAIIGTCMALEIALTSMGVTVVDQFTENQIKILPIFRMVATNVATAHGAGPMQSLPVEYQIGGAVMLSMLLYGGANFIGGKERGSKIHQLISQIASDNLVATPTPPPVNGARVPSPFEAAPPAATSGFDLSSIGESLKTYGPMLGAFLGNGSNKSKPTKRRKFHQ